MIVLFYHVILEGNLSCQFSLIMHAAMSPGHSLFGILSLRF